MVQYLNFVSTSSREPMQFSFHGSESDRGEIPSRTQMPLMPTQTEFLRHRKLPSRSAGRFVHLLTSPISPINNRFTSRYFIILLNCIAFETQLEPINYKQFS